MIDPKDNQLKAVYYTMIAFFIFELILLTLAFYSLSKMALEVTLASLTIFAILCGLQVILIIKSDIQLKFKDILFSLSKENPRA